MRHRAIAARMLLLTAVLLASASLSLPAAARTFATALTGANEFPEAGSPGGNGIATITVEDTGLAWAVWVNGIGIPTSVTLRKAPPGSNGPLAADLGAIHFTNGLATGFAKTSIPLRDDVFANPRDYYIQVTTFEYPGGAIRGQLDSGAAGLVAYTTALLGENEVPVATTQVIAGGANVTLVGSQLRYAIIVNGVLTPTSVVLARGLAGTNGPDVLDLSASFSVGVATGLLSIPQALADEIRANPSGFYVNVKSVDFPNGAIRGQLAPLDPVTVWIPTVAKAEGENGTHFVSDLRIYNPTSTKATVKIDLFAAASEASGPAGTKTIQVEEGAHAVVDDVLGTLFGTAGLGALKITSDRYLVVASRVLNDLRPSGRGTTGLQVPALALTEAPRSGALLMLSNATDFRTNIGYFNPLASPVHVTFQARKNDQTIVGSASLTLGPYARAQLPAFVLISATPPDEQSPANFYVTYTADAPLFVYGAVVDNVTGDGILVAGAAAR